jgi:hypothetical protein
LTHVHALGDSAREAADEQPAEIVDLVRWLAGNLGSAAIDLARDEILRYIDERLQSGDDEWIAVVGRGAEVGEWGKAVASYRKRQSTPV